MFDTNRRLTSIEQHLDKQDDHQANSLVAETELATGLRALATSFKDFTEKETVLMKEQVVKGEEASRSQLTVLNEIRSDLQGIKAVQKEQPKDFNILLEQTKTYNTITFVTKSHVKYVWIVVGLLVLSAVSGVSLMSLIKLF